MWSAQGLLIRGLLPTQPLLAPDVGTEVAVLVADHVRRSLAAAPAHLRIGLRVLTAGLAAWLFLFVAARSPWLGRRAASDRALLLFEAVPRLGPNLMRLYRSLTLLAFYDHPRVAQAMGWENAEARQAHYRAERKRLLRTQP